MASMPALKLGLWDRVVVRPRMAADPVMLDATPIDDRATYEVPEQSPIGLPHVLVNGVFAVSDGQYTGARAGRMLRAH